MPGMNQSEIDLLEIIHNVDEWKGCQITYEPVPGGITNLNWKVLVNGVAFFVKIPGRGTEEFIDRHASHVANSIAAALGIGPALFQYFNDSGVEIFEWLEGYRTLNFSDVFNKNLFYLIIDNIRTFHKYSDRTIPRTQTPFEQTADFIRLAKEMNCYLPPEMDRMEWLAQCIEDSIMSGGIDLVPCHNDFWTPNYLYNESTSDLKLTDFEYAAMSDECWDFADISTANYFTEAMDIEWIRYYYGEHKEMKFARFKLYKILKDIAWAMWAVLQAKQSTIHEMDYFEFFGAKMARLKNNWNDPRIDYWLCLTKGMDTF
jgi:thiamine kinase-like enzyme